MFKRKTILGLVLAGVVFCSIRAGNACTQAPVADLTVELDDTTVGVTVTFDGSDSYAKDGKTIVKYEWDFDGDGTYDCNEVPPCDGITTYAYTSGGTYTVKLRVTDNHDITGTDTCVVNIRGVHNVTQDEWYGSIQSALNGAVDNDVIEVAEGTWNETVDFNGVNCLLRSTDPNDYDVVAGTIIDANGGTAAVTFNDGEGSGAMLQGLTLTGGDYGVFCSDSSNPTIKQCIIKDNDLYGLYSSSSTPPTVKNCIVYDNNKGMGFSGATSAGVVRNNTIVDNTTEGIIVLSGTAPTVSNCILWNSSNDLDGCSATYSCIQDGDSGTGNISSYPYFENYNGDDFHLTWNSPYINKGDPNGNYDGEFDIDGDARVVDGQVDMGADEFFKEELVMNPGFEDGSYNGIPLYWVEDCASTSKSLDSAVKHSGTYSWKFVNNTTTLYSGAVSDFIPIEYGKAYLLSAWMKSETENESVYLGWREYDTNKTFLNNVIQYFVLRGEKIPASWVEFSMLKKPEKTEAAYVKLLFFGPSQTVGTVWWDDFSLKEMGTEYLPPCGFVNEPNVIESIDFGRTNDDDPDYHGGIVWWSSSSMGDRSTDSNDSNIAYRVLKHDTQVTLEFPAFNIPESYNPNDPNDPNSFPLTPMLLEIMYKDTVDDNTTGFYADPYDLVCVLSRIDTINLDPNYLRNYWQFESIAHLGGSNDNQWKYLQYAFQKSNFQRLRAIGGKFRITIQNFAEADLPIDYVGLRKITQAEYEAFAAKQRLLRGFSEIPLPCDSPLSPNYPDPNITVFVRDIMRPVYRHTKPASNEPCSITAFSCWDEIEPLSFAIYSQNGISDLTVSVSNLSHSDGNCIDGNDISILHVIYNETRLKYVTAKYEDWLGTGVGYALQPDWLEEFSELSVDANTSERVWLKVEVPSKDANLPDGLYEGDIYIKKNGVTQKTIPVDFTIYNITLEKPNHISPVIGSPFLRVYSNKLDEIFKAYRETKFDPFESSSTHVITIDSNDPLVFNTVNYEKAIDRMIEEGFAKDKVMVWVSSGLWQEVYRIKLGQEFNSADPCLYFNLQNQNFVDGFKSIIEAYESVANDPNDPNRNLHFIYNVYDEPGINPFLRIATDRLLHIIRDDCNKETMVTYFPSNDSPLHIDPNVYQLPDACDCTLPALTNLVDYKVWNPNNEGCGYTRHNDPNNPNHPSISDHFGYYTTSHSHYRNPVYNRFLHGLFAFSTDSEVVFAYAMGDYEGDPYNDFDPIYCSLFPFTYPDFLYAYPTWSGKLLPTIGGLEAIREGTKDAQYIVTLQKLIQQYPNDPCSADANDYLDDLKNRINPNYTTYSSQQTPLGYYHKILEDISNDPNDFEAFTEIRKKIADYIVAIDPNL